MPRGHKGEPRTPGAGRKAGTPNKLTIAAKEAFQHAFDGLGGIDGLVTWARDNQTDFYKIYGRLIPADINAKLTGAVKVDGTLNFIRKDDKL